MFRRSQIEVSWHRTRGTGPSTERAVVRRDGWQEEQFESLNDLPPEIRQMFEGFLGDDALSMNEAPVTAELVPESNPRFRRESSSGHMGMYAESPPSEFGRRSKGFSAKSLEIQVPLQQPDGIEVSRAGGTLQLRYRWFGAFPVIGGVIGAAVFAWPIVVEG